MNPENACDHIARALAAAQPASQWVGIANLAVGILSVIGLFLYVAYTVRTFDQIRQQTEAQTRAFLIIARCKHEGEPSCSDEPPKPSIELHDKWRAIINKNLPDAVEKTSPLYILLRNSGRSDVTWWELTVNVSVDPGPILGSYVKSTTNSWTLTCTKQEQYVEPGKSVKVLIGQSGCLPSATFSWKIIYRDFSGRQYEESAGDGFFTVENPKALQLRSPASQSQTINELIQ